MGSQNTLTPPLTGGAPPPVPSVFCGFSRPLQAKYTLGHRLGISLKSTRPLVIPISSILRASFNLVRSPLTIAQGPFELTPKTPLKQPPGHRHPSTSQPMDLVRKTTGPRPKAMVLVQPLDWSTIPEPPGAWDDPRNPAKLLPLRSTHLPTQFPPKSRRQYWYPSGAPRRGSLPA